VGEKCTQNVLGDFKADAVGERGGHFLQCLLGLQTRGLPQEPEGVGLRRLSPTYRAGARWVLHPVQRWGPDERVRREARFEAGRFEVPGRSAVVFVGD
jgi:hypothetical protein